MKKDKKKKDSGTDKPKKQPIKKKTPDYNEEKIARIAEQKVKAAPKNTGEDEAIRLNRFIANAGICSRRDADELIQQGKITVNGTVVNELGTKVLPTDKVVYQGKVLEREARIYLLLNKPKGFITTLEDPQGRRTVMDLVGNACEERIYPVGRLDRDTTGLLLFTNDGELAKKMAHPSGRVKKIYHVELDKPFAQADFERLTSGEFELEDGPVDLDGVSIISEDRKRLGVQLHSGKNRIVRRIFEHMRYEVIRLDRTVYADLTKKDLPRGKWRFLTQKEVITLKFFTGKG